MSQVGKAGSHTLRKVQRVPSRDYGSRFELAHGLEYLSANVQVIEMTKELRMGGSAANGPSLALWTAWVAFHHDPNLHVTGEEGALSREDSGRSHLPLRGKLGWMTPGPVTPRPGHETRLRGAYDPKRRPLNYLLRQPKARRLPKT
jgi:hypothetical protein